MDGTVWYFAYGANMSTEVFVRRRGIQPISSEAAYLDNYQLVFDQAAIPWIEPCFAGIAPALGATVHGVLHLLSHEAAAQVDTFEGPTYEVINVPVTGKETGQVTARTYQSRQPHLGLKPSRRYLRILIAGAEEFSLPPSYLENLRQEASSHIPLLSPLVTYVVNEFDRPGMKSRVLRGVSHVAMYLLRLPRRLL